jgi:recombination protein RecA
MPPKKKSTKKKKTTKKKIKAVVEKSKKKVDKKLRKTTALIKTSGKIRTSKKVEKIYKSVVDEFSEEWCKLLNNNPKPVSEGISFGCPSINLICTGNPFVGLVRGRIYEIFGEESSGKTTLLLMAIAECQAKGDTAAFVDAEHAFDPIYAKRLGIELQDLLVSQPDCGEDALTMVETFVDKGVNIIGIDSVAALTPRAEIEGEMGQTHIGIHARLMGQALRKLTAKVAKSKSTVIFLNQNRVKVGVMFGSPVTQTGGNALKFYSSVRLEAVQLRATKRKILGIDKKHIGAPFLIKCVKNKIYIPFGQAEVKCYFGYGFDRIGDLYSLAVAQNLISKSNKVGFYNIPGIGRVSNLQEYVPDVEDLVREYYSKKSEREDE